MSTKTPDILSVSWEEIDKDSLSLIKKIKELLNSVSTEDKNIKIIIPCRGGEVIGSLLKNSLGLQEENILRIKFSNQKYINGIESVIIPSKSEEKIFNDFIKDSSKYLSIFVDDLVDSGLTIDYIKDRIKGYLLTAVLYSKEGKNKEKVNVCVKDLKDKWIVFPWENFYK